LTNELANRHAWSSPFSSRSSENSGRKTGKMNLSKTTYNEKMTVPSAKV